LEGLLSRVQRCSSLNPKREEIQGRGVDKPVGEEEFGKP
jgi:hypothetical protein